MISFVIASKDPDRLQAAQAMLASAMAGQPWELIAIHSPSSLAQAYNQAVTTLRGDIVVFCHDDITIISPGFPRRLQEHLAHYDIVGVAGANRLINASWVTAGVPYIFGQVGQPNPDDTITIHIYNAPSPVAGNMLVLDGVFMAMRRSVLAQCRFDEATFDGFHHYDLDFSLTAFTAGFHLAVANDINLLHRSGGVYDGLWYKYADRFVRKWPAHVRTSIPPPFFSWASATVKSPQQAVQLMNPAFWRHD